MTAWPRRAGVLAACLLGGLFVPQAPGDTLSTPLDAVANIHQLSDEYAPGDVYMGIRLLGTLKLAPVEPDNLPMAGLSGLAFDEDENILYALSDLGRIYHLRPRFENAMLKELSVLAVYRLRDAQGKPLKGRQADSEGLTALNERNTVTGDTELVISFERMHRILRFNPQGKYLGSIKLPPRLAEKNHYRSANQGLESITFDPRLGLLTATERPLKDAPAGSVDIFALSRPGQYWRYPLAPEPNAALVAMEALADGSILTLERAHGAFFVPFITTLKHIHSLGPGRGETVSVETVARLSTSQGWDLDNFEGLTRHTGNRFFMISDDNGVIYQSTLLSYFEVLEHDPLQRSRPPSALESSTQAP